MFEKKINAPFEVKSVDVKERTFEGYASIFDILDEDGDIVERGAFKKTVAERVKSGKVKLLDHHRYGSTENILGKILEAKEDEKGLSIKAYVSETQAGDDLLTKIKEGVVDALSFGYDVVRKTIDESGDSVIRKLQELKLWEVSPVTWGANQMALITPGSVKNKAVPPNQSFPLADRDRPWDSSAAVKRLRRFASSDGSGDKDKVNFTQYKNFFFWYDAENKESFGSYKLPYTDVIDGKVKAVPRGIFSVAAVLQGARGGADISSSEQGTIKSRVNKWYNKMELTPPWKGLILLGEVKKIFEGQDNPCHSEEGIKELKEFSQSLADYLASLKSPEQVLCEIEGNPLIDMSDAKAKMRGLRLGLLESEVN